MIKIIEAGIASTVQDNGRFGYKAFGVPQSGAFDGHAHNCANILIGNSDNCATLEIIAGGLHIQFNSDTFIAIAGAEMHCLLNGEAVVNWSAFPIAAGSTLRFGYASNGKCAYLAIPGGISTEPMLESRSTYCRAHIGGIAGRPLKSGDEFRLPAVNNRPQSRLVLPDAFVPAYNSSVELRCVLGPQSDYFTKQSVLDCFSNPYTITPDFDRMGCRLQGKALVHIIDSELISQPLLPGAVQAPKNGQPIVMLADAQTCGGYPIIAVIISADLPKLAQANAGDSVRFILVTQECARKIYIEERLKLSQLIAFVNNVRTTNAYNISVNKHNYLVSVREQ